MLIELQIDDFAVVKSLNLEFQPNMSVITGETGAGKSILLDALGLALGERADSQWVRPDCDKADIYATFDISQIPSAVLWLTDSELINPDGEQTCLIRRVLYKNGRSKAFINGKPATTTQLKLLGENLVQIHGQHQHQLLLKPFEQLRLLDAFGKHSALLDQVKKSYESYENIQKEIEVLTQNISCDPSRLNLLQYQVDELNKLNLQPDEWEQITLEQKKLSFAQQDIEHLDQALSALNHDEQNGLEHLQQAQHALGPLQDRYENLRPVLELLKTAQIHVEEAIGDLSHMVQAIDINPARLQELESRSSAIYSVARKHRVEVHELIDFHVKLKHELECFEGADQKLDDLKQSLAHAKSHYLKVANKLSKARSVAAKQMSKEIESWLEPLGIKGGSFDIELMSHEEPTSHGLESIQFKVSTNPGHPLSPLQKVVSGGELSRISLAIQLIAAKYQNTPTLIFDEVDVGVGGKIGAIIGQALGQLAANVQVLCITHLPQVAAFGTSHFQVSKQHQQQSTSTTITPLTQKQRIEEIARMLGGLDITKQARANAKALLEGKKQVEIA